MVTSFADGTKISFEQAIVANATGFGVLQRGMSTRAEIHDGHVDELSRPTTSRSCASWVASSTTSVGPAAVKVFVLAEHPDPKQRHYLELYKLGDGPLYSFYTPTTSSTSRCRTRSRAPRCSATTFAAPRWAGGRGLRRARSAT